LCRDGGLADDYAKAIAVRGPHDTFCMIFCDRMRLCRRSHLIQTLETPD
jgi:hypothetical protein